MKEEEFKEREIIDRFMLRYQLPHSAGTCICDEERGIKCLFKRYALKELSDSEIETIIIYSLEGKEDV